MNSEFTSGFTRYESFRILLPGFICTFLIYLDFFLFNEETFHKMIGAGYLLLFTVLSLIIGLILYEVDIPRKLPYFKSIQKMYSARSYLTERCKSCPYSLPPLNNEKIYNWYFYMFNSKFDTNTRERVFYFGSVYYLYTHFLFLAALFEIVSLVLFILNIQQHWFDEKLLLQFLALLLFGILICLLNKKSAKHKKYLREMFVIQKTWLELNENLVNEIICKRCREINLTSGNKNGQRISK